MQEQSRLAVRPLMGMAQCSADVVTEVLKMLYTKIGDRSSFSRTEVVSSPGRRWAMSRSCARNTFAALRGELDEEAEAAEDKALTKASTSADFVSSPCVDVTNTHADFATSTRAGPLWCSSHLSPALMRPTHETDQNIRFHFRNETAEDKALTKASTSANFVSHPPCEDATDTPADLATSTRAGPLSETTLTSAKHQRVQQRNRSEHFISEKKLISEKEENLCPPALSRSSFSCAEVAPSPGCWNMSRSSARKASAALRDELEETDSRRPGHVDQGRATV